MTVKKIQPSLLPQVCLLSLADLDGKQHSHLYWTLQPRCASQSFTAQKKNYPINQEDNTITGGSKHPFERPLCIDPSEKSPDQLAINPFLSSTDVLPRLTQNRISSLEAPIEDKTLSASLHLLPNNKSLGHHDFLAPLSLNE